MCIHFIPIPFLEKAVVMDVILVEVAIFIGVPDVCFVVDGVVNVEV